MWSGSRNISGSQQSGSGFYFETGAPYNQYIKATVGGQIEINASGSGGGTPGPPGPPGPSGSSAPTGSLLVTASIDPVDSNTIKFTKGDGSTFSLTVNTGSGTTTTVDTGSLLVTASIDPINSSDIKFTKGNGTTFKITTGNDKANLSGGNTFTGDQTVTGDVTVLSISTPIVSGKSLDKTNIGIGATLPIFTFQSGSYSSLIIDGYVIASNPEYYAIQTVFAIPNSGDIAATIPYIFSVDTLKTSFSASAEYDERGILTKADTFGTGSLIFSSDYNGSNARILLENLSEDKNNSPFSIVYRTIVRAFPND
jgi:hypothetical protein